MQRSKTLWIAACALWLGACGKGPEETAPPADATAANRWIYSVMKEQYLYNDHVKSLTPNYSLATESFFTSLLSSSPNDNDGKHKNGKNRFYSYMESTGTKGLSGNQTAYGLDFQAYTIPDIGTSTNPYIMARVLYVVPESPADRAGLRRGDWIYKADGKLVQLSDADRFVSGGAVTFTVQKIEKRIENGKEGYYVTDERPVRLAAAEAMNISPLLSGTVIGKGSRKIGYVVYNSFDTGPKGPAANDYSYDQQLKALFADFKTRGVDELVLDLRYNGGGYVSSCQLLCSLIVGEQHLGQSFCFYKYNPDLTAQRGEPEMKLLGAGEVSAGNLNLDRLYVLTGPWTASASELVINSLRPYMTVVVVGTQTEGKNVGSYEIKSDAYKIALHPITLQFFNKDRRSDYKDGFTPDIVVDDLDNQDQWLELGDPDEYVLSRAIADMTGRVTAGSKAAQGAEGARIPVGGGSSRLYGLRGAIVETPDHTEEM